MHLPHRKARVPRGTAAAPRRLLSVEALEGRWVLSTAPAFALPAVHPPPAVRMDVGPAAEWLPGAQSVAAVQAHQDRGTDSPGPRDHNDGGRGPGDVPPVSLARWMDDHRGELVGHSEPHFLPPVPVHHSGNTAAEDGKPAAHPAGVPRTEPGLPAGVEAPGPADTEKRAGSGLAGPAAPAAPAEDGAVLTAASVNADPLPASADPARPVPQWAGVIADVLPVDPEVLEAGLRLFLAQVGEAAPTWLDPAVSTCLGPWAGAVGLALAGGILARHRRAAADAAPALDERRPSGIYHQWDTHP